MDNQHPTWLKTARETIAGVAQFLDLRVAKSSRKPLVAESNRWVNVNIEQGHAMSDITVSVPDEALQALKATPEEMGAELRLAAAVKLYELRRLSSGAAAKLAAIPRTLFLTKLAEYGVAAFQLTEEELARGKEAWKLLDELPWTRRGGAARSASTRDGCRDSVSLEVADVTSRLSSSSLPYVFQVMMRSAWK